MNLIKFGHNMVLFCSPCWDPGQVRHACHQGGRGGLEVGTCASSSAQSGHPAHNQHLIIEYQSAQTAIISSASSASAFSIQHTLLYMFPTLSSSLLVSFTFSKETTWMRCQLKYGIWVTRLAELTFSRKIQLLECVMVADLLSKLICAEGGVRVLVEPTNDRLV